MASIEDNAQRYLDYVANPSCFCEGRLMTVRPSMPTMAPNCGRRDECKLFRRSGGSPVRQIIPGMCSNPDKGCEMFRAFEAWKQREQLWIVALEGCEPREVRASNPQTAACAAFWELHRLGIAPDKMVLLDGRYQVREA